MKFTLSQNGISSLSIAIEHFKKFYYSESTKRSSEIDEEIKIALVFLENAMELLLKSVLITIDETSIYRCPESKRIQKAKSLVNTENTLAEILLKSGNFKTIDYHEVVDKYIELTGETSKKFEHILKQLSYVRNSITHFGLDITSYDEIVLLFFNTFDVIYNYLYDKLSSLDDIGGYFTSDEMIVDTIHGSKFLFSEDFIYNNIIDLLDEILVDNNDYIFKLRANNGNTKISLFSNLLAETIEDKNFKKMLDFHNIRMSVSKEDILNHNYDFNLDFSENISIEVLARYSPFYNATVFMNDGAEIMFIVLHNESVFYLYKEDVTYPELDERENDNQWIVDEQNNLCEKYNLSKRNLIKAFEYYIKKQGEIS